MSRNTRVAYEASSSKNTYRIYVFPSEYREDVVSVCVYKETTPGTFNQYFSFYSDKYTEGPAYKHTTTIYPNRVWWKPWTWKNIGLSGALNKMIECVEGFIKRENERTENVRRTLLLLDSSAELIESQVRGNLEEKYPIG